MKEHVVAQDQVLTHGEIDLQDPERLRLYYKAFGHEGVASDFPLIVVGSGYQDPAARSKVVNNEARAKYNWLSNYRKVPTLEGNPSTEEIIQRLRDLEEGTMPYRDLDEGIESIYRLQEKVALYESKLAATPFVLVDGNHRGTAMILRNGPLYLLEIESDEDLAELSTLVESGELATLAPRLERARSMHALITEIEDHILFDQGAPDDRVNDVLPMDERVRRLLALQEEEGSEYIPEFMLKEYKG